MIFIKFSSPPRACCELSASKPSVSFLAENLSLRTDISRPDLGTEFAQHVPLIFAKIYISYI